MLKQFYLDTHDPHDTRTLASGQRPATWNRPKNEVNIPSTPQILTWMPKTAIVEAENTTSKALFQVCRVQQASFWGVTRPLKPIINLWKSKTSKKQIHPKPLVWQRFNMWFWFGNILFTSMARIPHQPMLPHGLPWDTAAMARSGLPRSELEHKMQQSWLLQEVSGA